MKLTGKLINSLINSLSKNNLAMYLKKANQLENAK